VLGRSGRDGGSEPEVVLVPRDEVIADDGVDSDVPEAANPAT